MENCPVCRTTLNAKTRKCPIEECETNRPTLPDGEGEADTPLPPTVRHTPTTASGTYRAVAEGIGVPPPAPFRSVPPILRRLTPMPFAAVAFPSSDPPKSDTDPVPAEHESEEFADPDRPTLPAPPPTSSRPASGIQPVVKTEEDSAQPTADKIRSGAA